MNFNEKFLGKIVCCGYDAVGGGVLFVDLLAATRQCRADHKNEKWVCGNSI